MLHYPKIPDSRNYPDGKCIDFGTRRDAFNLTEAGIADFIAKHQHLGECVDVFYRDWAQQLERVFQDRSQYREIQEIKVFTEFIGANSFADRWEDYWE